MPILLLQEASHSVQTLLHYREHCEDTEIDEIRSLERLERELRSLELNTRSQQTLDPWIIWLLEIGISASCSVAYSTTYSATFR